jgi:transcriptional regulator with XRE-family HTH domain
MVLPLSSDQRPAFARRGATARESPYQAQPASWPHTVRVNDDDRYLGGLLRAWRERLVPEDVGLPSRGTRRTPGLRREEVAQLAGMSVDYIVRLEQGRSTTPSGQVVASLARALQLRETETDLLFTAAGLTPPSAATVSHHLPPGIQRMLVRMADLPLAAFAADWTRLTSTALWRALFESGGMENHPNLIVQTFVDDTVARVATAHGGSDAFERALVADLRRSAAHLATDIRLRAFIADVRGRSPRFARLWDEGVAAPHRSLTKTVHHPVVGDIELDCDVVTVPDSDVKLVVYSTPARGPDAEKLDFLRVAAVSGEHDIAR